MRRSAILFVLLIAACSPTAAQDFYKGKTIKMIIGPEAGGSYDAHGRLLARHMPKYIPGSPTIVVMNMSGGSGLIAANHLFNVAERDGTTIGSISRYVPMAVILGNESAKFRPDEFNWIGTATSYSDNSYVFIIRSALPHRTIEDLRNPNMPLHAATGSADVLYILQEALGLTYKIVSGYKGTMDIDLSFARGEVDGTTTGWQSIVSRNEDWLKTNFIRPMIQFGRVDRLPALKDVPTARELARTPDDRALIEFGEAPLLMALPFLTPPGVPADRVAILRKAFMQAVSDPAYKEDVAKQKIELTPRSGEDVQTLVASLVKANPSVIARYKKAVEGRPGPSGG